MKGSLDINVTYQELKKAYPGQVVAFCCDLGEEWLFKFTPKAAIGDQRYISGYFGTAVGKKTGKIRQYNMLENMKEIQKKANLKGLLKG